LTGPADEELPIGIRTESVQDCRKVVVSMGTIAPPEMAAGAFVHEDETFALVQQRDGLHRGATTFGSVAGSDVNVQ
jgi:hypothetical protein